MEKLGRAFRQRHESSALTRLGNDCLFALPAPKIHNDPSSIKLIN
jgi:hypothetical protein